MKHLRNEYAMALVTVLLIITVFSIVGLSVMSLSISNAKQVTKTEQEMQAVDLAEMGVVYYKSAFIKKANEVLTAKRAEAQANIDLQNSSNTNNGTTIPINKDTILQELSTILENMKIEKKLNTFLPSIPLSSPITIEKNSSYSFEFEYTKIDYDKTSNKIIVDLKSTGSVPKNQNESLESTIELDIEELITVTTRTGTGTGTGTTKISKPTGLSDCIYNGETLVTNCSYKEAGTIKTNYDNKSKEVGPITALINGSLNLYSSKKMHIDNSFLYITNDATFGDFNGNVSGLTLYVGGNATFSDFSGGVKGNSTILIVGNAVFGGKETSGVKDGSIVCVGGTISGITDRSNVYEWKNNENVCGKFGGTSSSPVQSTLLDLLPNLAEQAEDMKLKYD